MTLLSNPYLPTRIKTLAVQKAAFLDRDGVINIDLGYLYRWEDFQWMPGALEGMRQLQALGYALVVVTNQSGIARGYYTEDDFQSLSNTMRHWLHGHGIDLAGIFYCPHHPQGSEKNYTEVCNCRKPAPGLIVEAAKQLGLSLQDSVMVGDKVSDMQAAESAGIEQRYHLTSDEPYVGCRQVGSLIDVAHALVALDGNTPAS